MSPAQAISNNAMPRRCADLPRMWHRDDACTEKMGELGFVGVRLSEDCGGSGLDLWYTTVLIQEGVCNVWDYYFLHLPILTTQFHYAPDNLD